MPGNIPEPEQLPSDLMFQLTWTEVEELARFKITNCDLETDAQTSDRLSSLTRHG
jgi:hypothetical protein